MSLPSCLPHLLLFEAFFRQTSKDGAGNYDNERENYWLLSIKIAIFAAVSVLAGEMPGDLGQQFGINI